MAGEGIAFLENMQVFAFEKESATIAVGGLRAVAIKLHGWRKGGRRRTSIRPGTLGIEGLCLFYGGGSCGICGNRIGAQYIAAAAFVFGGLSFLKPDQDHAKILRIDRSVGARGGR